MVRVLIAVGALMCISGCASKGDRIDREEMIGASSAAVGTPWDGDASTRSVPTDNTSVAVTSTVGPRGVVTNADAGMCWITAISGSFRGDGERAIIDTDPNTGYYRINVTSNTSYDGVNGVGPAMGMRCRRFTDFTVIGNVPGFSSTGYWLSGTPPTGGPNYGQASSSATSGNIFPWGGVEGRLNDAGGATWAISAVDHTADATFVRWPIACPSAPTYTDCKVAAARWETSYSGHTWTYSVTGASASNTQDVQLISASGQECYIDGVWGWWTATSSAKVEVQADGYWHLVTTKGSAALGTGAYAACFPLAQGF